VATIQLSTTKIANKLISYCEKRATERDGVDCPPQYAKSQFKATRELWGKSKSVQAHHVIQSFKPGEVNPEQANEIGKQLAKELANGYEAVIYTHTDKDHIHNHIVINAVSYEDGKKYRAHGKEAIERVRDISDRLCQERELSVVNEKTADVRYTLSEKALVEKEQYSWKDTVRESVNHVKQTTNSYVEFKQDLLDKHGIEIQERGKHTTYINHENGKRVRGNKLGEAYEKETIKHEFERKVQHGQKRGNRELFHDSKGKLQFNEHVFRATRTDRGENERFGNGTVQRNEKVHAARNRIRESTEEQKRISPTEQQSVRETSPSHEESTNRSSQKPTGADPHRKDRTSIDEQGTCRASNTNESTSPGNARTRDEIQAGTKANPEGTLDGNRIANSGDRSVNIDIGGNDNPTPSVSGGGLLDDVMKAVEQAAKQIDAQHQSEQAKQKQRLPTRQQQKSQYLEI